MANPRIRRPTEMKLMTGTNMTKQINIRMTPFEYGIMRATMKELHWRERDVSSYIRTLILHEAELAGFSLEPTVVVADV